MTASGEREVKYGLWLRKLWEWKQSVNFSVDRRSTWKLSKKTAVHWWTLHFQVGFVVQCILFSHDDTQKTTCPCKRVLVSKLKSDDYVFLQPFLIQRIKATVGKNSEDSEKTVFIISKHFDTELWLYPWNLMTYFSKMNHFIVKLFKPFYQKVTKFSLKIKPVLKSRQIFSHNYNFTS